MNHEKAFGPRLLPWWKRRRLMQAFFLVVMMLGLAIVAYPFLPLLIYQIRPPQDLTFPYASRLGPFGQLPDLRSATLPRPDVRPRPEGNRLVIPTIGVDMAIVEGRDENALLNGAWRIPATAPDPETGNMVLSAHRFRYRPPSSETFYLLNKVVAGDVFIVYWEGREYDYRVRETKIVDPTQIEILDQTESPQVTLFTCTPLFSTSKRLVVIGDPIAS